jgi:tetratricopeptide (TPR) repeat protein
MYPFDYGPVTAYAQYAVIQGSEEDALDLVGLLMLTAATAHYDSSYDHWNENSWDSKPATSMGGRAILALSLADAAAKQFDTCDAHLAKAHALSLLQLGPSAWGEDLGEAFDTAVSACPADPTASVLQAMFEIKAGSSTCGDSPSWKAFASPDSWSKLADDTAFLVAQWPNVAAVHVVAGDTYRVLAEVATPFSARHYRELATVEYQHAMALSPDPSIGISLAANLLEVGRVETAREVIDTVAAAAPDAPGVHLALARVAAFEGNFAAASQEASLSTQDLDLPRDPVLVPSLVPVTVPGNPVTVTMLGGSWCAGGSSVEDLGFVPTWRPTITMTFLMPAYFRGEENVEKVDFAEEEREDFALLVTTVAGAPSDLQDKVQNLLRRFGRLEEAATVVTQWTAAQPTSGLAWERLGEIYFLQERWAESLDASVKATGIYDRTGAAKDSYNPKVNRCDRGDFTGPGWVELREAATARKMGEYRQALAALGHATTNMPVQCESSGLDGRLYLPLEHGQLAYLQEDYESALHFMTEASEQQVGERGAAEQGASLSAFALGRYEEALSWAQQALIIDPYNPLYQEAVADAQRALGQDSPPSSQDESTGPTRTVDPNGSTAAGPATTEEPSTRADLIAIYQASLDLDPTLFSSWNNMGVLLAQEGEVGQAKEAFEQAIAVMPDYAWAWHNLGVVEAGQFGLTHFLRSQGALGIANNLNTSFKNADPVLTFDDNVYQSGLDVSKAIPPDWRLANTVRTTPSLLTIGLVIIIVLRVAWDLGKDWIAGTGAAKAMSSLRTSRHWPRWLTGRIHPMMTALVSLAALVWLTGPAGLGETIAVVASAGALLGLHTVIPHILSDTPASDHTSSLPASVVTAVLAPFGLGFAPPAPLAGVNDQAPTKVRWAGPISLAAMSVVFAGLAIATGVPITRALAMGALLVLSSALVPVHPLDGSRIDLGRWADLAVTLALAGGTILIALAVI